MRQDRENILIVLVFALFCLILYFNSLWGIFIFDDTHSIVNNLFIKGSRYIPLFFKGYYTSETDVPKGMFRPLLLLTFNFNYFFSGLQPLGYHIINILLHFVNGVLFYYFLRLLKPDLPFSLALLFSALFLSHPINTETVTYISSRSDLMISLFIFLGLIAYFKKRFFLALILYVFSLLTKENALVFALLISAFVFIYYRQNTKIPQNGKRNIYFYFFLIGITLFYLAYRGIIFGQLTKDVIWASLKHSPVRSLWSNVLTQSAVTLFYLRLFLWPNLLTVHHNFPILNSLFNPLAFFSALTISGLVIFIFVFKKRQPLVSFGLAWYFICLMPKFFAHLNIVAAEHHFYLPGFGIYLIFAVITKNLYLKFKRKFTIIAVGIISVFTVLVWFRNYEYKDDFTFWRKAVESCPSSSIAHYDLGVAYLIMGLYPEAEEEFKKAQFFAPRYATRAYKNVQEGLASTYRLQKRFNEALSKINGTIKAGFYDFYTYQVLGEIYLDMGDEEKAQDAWGKSLSLNPKAARILSNLGTLYLRKGQLFKAKEYFQAAIEADPFLYTSYFGLACVLEEEGNIDAAIKAHEKSARLQPNFVGAHYHLGTFYAKKNDARALRHLKEVVRLAPKFAEGHNNLAVFYASMDPAQLELARQHAQKALSLGYKVEERFLKIIAFPQAEQTDKN